VEWAERRPAEAEAAGPLKVGGNVQAARILNRVQPVYPPLARQTRISGTVRLHAIISKDGSIQAAGSNLWPPAAAAERFGCRPSVALSATLLNGEPVEVDTTIDVIFLS